MAIDYRKIGFDSRHNYLKRKESNSKTVNMSSANTWYEVKVPINLDYDAMVHVGVNLGSQNTMWANNFVYPEMMGFSPNQPPQLEYYWTRTNLYIRIFTGSSPGTRTVWWAVYHDYRSVT